MKTLSKPAPEPSQAPVAEPQDTGAPIQRKKHTLLRSKAVRTRRIVRMKSGVDRPFLIIVILLLCIGTTMVFSASYAYAKHNFDGDSYYFVRRQLLWGGASLIGMWGVSTLISYRFLRRFTKLILGAAGILLVLVLLIGKEVNGATRWIELGPVQVQPSEIAKFAIVMFFADYIERHQRDMKRFSVGVLPFLVITGRVCGLLLPEPHLSAMIIILLLTAAMMFMGGTRKAHFFTLAGLAGAGMALVMFVSDHGKSRIMNWLHPELDPTGAGWQPLQSLYAIGSGGVWGKGLGQSTQKHLWLPEPQNDYIFAVLCEEMGFVFAAAVIGLFVALVWRGFYIAKHAPDQYSTLVVLGLILQVAIQVVLNIAVVTNTIPSTGVSLPFFSYGGSALIIVMAEMGLILNISRYSLIEKS